MTYDPVTNPSHYMEGRRFGPTDVAEEWGLALHEGYALKYISRAGRKVYDGMTADESRIRDLEKAVEFLQRRLRLLRGGNGHAEPSDVARSVSVTPAPQIECQHTSG